MKPECDPEADLAPSDRLVLHKLRRAADGETTLTELQAATGLPSRTARDAADRLASKGYLDRQRCPTDPRSYRIVLTDD